MKASTSTLNQLVTLTDGSTFEGSNLVQKGNEYSMNINTGGVLTFPKEEFSTVDLVTPSIIERTMEAPKKTKKSTKATTSAKKKVKGAPSKKELATELFKSNKDASRKEIIALFVKELGMTQSGAATYHYNIKKIISK